MQQRRCARCGETKPLDQFPRNRGKPLGRDYQCRRCLARYLQTYRQTAKGKVNQKKGWDKYRLAGKEKQWRDNHPGATKAYKQVLTAKKTGFLKQPASCEVCGRSGKLDAHHEDYTKPFGVVWLCRSCHRNIHKLAS